MTTERHALTDRDVGVLAALHILWKRGRWARPMDLGGTDGSHHNATLKKLRNQGLVERKRRAGWTRPSYLYMISPGGRLFLRQLQSPPKPPAAERAFVRGYTAAVAEFARHETTPRTVLSSAGITRELAERCDVLQYDMDALAEHFPKRPKS